MATAKNGKTQNNNPNSAARLSALAIGGIRFFEVVDENCFSIDPDGNNSILCNNENDFEYICTGKHKDYCHKFRKYWQILTEADTLEGTDKVVREQIYCNIYINCIRHLTEFLPMAIKTWPFQFLAGFNGGNPCGCNLCLISNPPPLVKQRRIHLCIVFLQFWYRSTF